MLILMISWLDKDSRDINSYKLITYSDEKWFFLIQSTLLKRNFTTLISKNQSTMSPNSSKCLSQFTTNLSFALSHNLVKMSQF